MDFCTSIKMVQYSILPDDDEMSPSRSLRSTKRPLKLPKSTSIALLFMFTSIVSGIGGYIAGKRLERRESDGLIQCKCYRISFSRVIVNVISVNRVPVTFEYELNFAGPPSNLTNQRWKPLFPTYGGFFTHPSTGPDQVAFSVFHQLHCLVSPSEFCLPYKTPYTGVGS